MRSPASFLGVCLIACALPTSLRAAPSIQWLDLDPVPVGSGLTSGDTFVLPGYGTVEITFSGSLAHTRDQNAYWQNGSVTSGGATFPWATCDMIHQVVGHGACETAWTTQYSFTFTFKNGPVPAGALVFAAAGLGRLDVYCNPPSSAFITTIDANQPGSLLGEYDPSNIYGPTQFTSGSGFGMQNSLPGNGSNASFNSKLALVQVGGSVSSLTIDVTQIGTDGIEFNVGRIVEKCVDPPAGLVAWWPLDEAAGPTSHEVVGGQDATWAGTVAPWAPGVVINGLQTNSNGSTAMASTPGSIDFKVGSFTIDAWFARVDPSPGDGYMIVDRRVAGPVHGYAFFVQKVPARGLDLLIGDGTTQAECIWPSMLATPVVTPRHVTGVVDRAGGELRLYVDGGLVASSAIPAALGSLATGGGVRIGGPRAYLGNLAATDLDELEFFDRALTPAEITDLAQSASGGKCKLLCDMCPVLACDPSSNGAICLLKVTSLYPTSRTISVSFMRLAPGGNCNVAIEPGGISPPSTWTISPTSPLLLYYSMLCPPGLGVGQNACYDIVISDMLTGAAHVCHGVLTRLDGQIVVATPPATETVPVNSSTPVSWVVRNTGSSPAVFDYRVAEQPPESDPTWKVISLDAMPPGNAVTGVVSIPPSDSTTIGVAARPVDVLPLTPNYLLLEGSVTGIDPLPAIAAHGIETSGTPTVVAVPRPAPPRDGLFEIRNNPLEAGSLEIAFSLEHADRVEVKVFDILGRSVRTIASRPFGAGEQDLRWDGTDRDGHALQRGVYLIRMSSSAGRRSRRIVILK